VVTQTAALFRGRNETKARRHPQAILAATICGKVRGANGRNGRCGGRQVRQATHPGTKRQAEEVPARCRGGR